MLLEVEVLVSMERARSIPPRKAAVMERMKAALRQASVSENCGWSGMKRGGRSVVLGRILERKGSYFAILNQHHS